jgi:hypothetical protein
MGAPHTKLSEVTILGSEVKSFPDWVDIVFNDNIILNNGEMYAIVVGGDVYGLVWQKNSAGGYANGESFESDNGNTWVANGAPDMVFRTYLTAVHTKIWDVYDLQDMNLNLAGNYLLMNDIDASGTATWNSGQGFDPIGDTVIKFTGWFEGDGHVISDLYINRPTEYNIGFFGRIGPAGLAGNASLRNVNILGDYNVGGFIGINDGKVTNCSVSGIMTGDMDLGGFIGRNEGTVIDCSSTCTVSGNNYIGGFAGYNNQGVISKCYSSGPVSAYATVGGFIGYNYDAVITDCYSTGSSSGALQAGGFIGFNDIGTLNRCFSSGFSSVNGFIGSNSGGNVWNSFWDNGTAVATTDPAANERTTDQMMTQTTFSVPGWDFTNVWWMIEGQTRPFLRMEWSQEIRNSHQLQLMEMNKTADYTLENDINLSDITEPAQMWGTSPTVGNGFYSVGHIGAFIGTFSGNNHTLSNLYIDWVSNNQGLFGNTGTTSVVRDIRMTNLSINATDLAGGIVGFSTGKIFNCAVDGEITAVSTIGGIAGRADGDVGGCTFSGEISGVNFVGGLIGYSVGGSINNCNADVVLSGADGTGGLIGSCNGGSVANCSSSGTITAAGGSVGGLIGGNSAPVTDCMSDVDVIAPSSGQGQGGLIGYASNGAITRCLATGNVSGNNYVGGLSGYIAGTASAVMCYASGTVTGSGIYVGGLIGFQSGPTIMDSFARGDVSGTQAIGGLVGYGTGDLTNCYSVGTVTGTTNVGGFYGEFTAGVITNCHWDTVTSGTTDGVANIADPAGLLGHDTTAMMQQVTFGGWDFSNIWGIVETLEYPVLRALQQSDLDISLTFDSTYATVGNSYDLTMVLTNRGPDTAFNVKLSILIPTQMGLGGWTNSPVIEENYVNYTFGAMMNGWPTTQMLLLNANTYAPIIQIYGATTSESGDPGNYPNTQTLNVPMNRNPTANDDAYTIPEDSGLRWFNVMANDGADPDGDTLQITAVTQALNGIVAIAANGTWVSYTPNANFFGINTFTYTISDGNGGFDTATVTVTVTGINDPPVANNDVYTFDVAKNWTLLDVLANDVDPDVGDTKTITAVTVPLHGLVAIEAGKLNYTVNNTYIGTDTFNYTIEDAAGLTDTATVTVTITPVNRAPVANNDAYTVAEDSVTILNVLANDNDLDSDVLTIISVTMASHGTATIATGGISYTPTANYFGSDSFTYTINDAHSVTSTATVDITVTSVNDLPIISTTAVTTATVGTLYSVQYAATDVEDTAFTWGLTSDAGTWLTISTSGLLSGTPAAAGTFNVTVTATDSGAGFGTSGFTLVVSPIPNDAPVISTRALPSGNVSQVYGFKVIASDADGDALTWTLKTNATWLSINGTGYLSGTPTAAGTFYALITVNDGKVATAKNLTLTIRAADSGVDDTIVVAIGPVEDSNGNPVAGARVTVTYNGIEYTGTTDANGNANIELPETALGEQLDIEITKDGYGPVSYTTTLDEDGTLNDTPSSMEAKQSNISPIIIIIIIVIIVAVVAGLGLMLRPKKPLPAPPAPEAAPEPPVENTQQ